MKEYPTEGERKLPKTAAQRQAARQARLNAIAIEAGYRSWSEYETAVINDRTRIMPKVI